MKFLIAILILATVLIAGCTQQINSSILPVNSNKCPFEDAIKSCISDSSKGMVKYGDGFKFSPGCNNPLSENYSFYDSSMHQFFTTPYWDVEINCWKGSKEGENINNYYCISTNFQLAKDVTSSEGVVQEKIRYNIHNIILNSTKDVIHIECQKT